MTSLTDTHGTGPNGRDPAGPPGHGGTSPGTRRPVPAPATGHAARRPGGLAGTAHVARRRLALSIRTPRELAVPVLTPLLFALVIAPALADVVPSGPGGVDYMTFVAVSTIGLLVPLSALSQGLGVLVDRIGGGGRDLLAAPLRRPLIVLGNLLVAVGLGALQVLVVVVGAGLRGAEYDVRATGAAWFVAGAVGFAVAMYGIAEVLANRISTQEEYIGALPPVAIVPWFFAGALFPIAALPVGLTVVAKVLPITHVLALLRYGLVDPSGGGLHDIWGMDDPTTMAALSLAVVTLFAAVATTAAIRTFTRTSLR